MPSPDAVTPPALRQGDTIAFVSPSARLNALFPLRVARAKSFLESQGFLVKEFFTTSLPSSFRAAVATRAAELHSAFMDPSVRAIVCCIGGLAANELIPALDYALIRENPKIFTGSSDITLLHHALFAGAGLRTFYGPSAITQLGEFPQPLEFTWQNFIKVLINEQDVGFESVPRALEWTEEFMDWNDEKINVRPRRMRPSTGWRWLREGKAEGKLWGGCLPSILQLFGTPWEIDYDGRILFLELPEGLDPGKGWPLEFARWNLGDLGTRGVWDKIRGLVIGRTYMYTEQETADWERTVLEITEGYDFPILAGVDVGHTDPMLTVPLDIKCRIDSEKDDWTFLEKSVHA